MFGGITEHYSCENCGVEFESDEATEAFRSVILCDDCEDVETKTCPKCGDEVIAAKNPGQECSGCNGDFQIICL